MFNIRDFLSKFSKLDASRETKINQIAESIEKYSGIFLKPEEIQISINNEVRIKTTPIKRNQIFLYKEKIINEIGSKGISITLQ